MTARSIRHALAAVAAFAALAAIAPPVRPIVYTVRVPAPDSHYLEIEAEVPTSGLDTVELMVPVWSPGYYRIEPYGDNIDRVAARAPDGTALTVEKPRANRWRVRTGGASTIRLSYRVLCNQHSVTTNDVGRDYGVINGAPTFMTLAEPGPRAHEVRLELPPQWARAMSGLDAAPDRQPNHFRALDYETLVDSPILAGALDVREFTVAGKRHYVASAGNLAGWDGDAAVRDLSRFVEEAHRFWGFLPYDKYVFLLAFRQGGGGLEHKNSTLSTVAAGGGAPWRGIGLLTHEYFHLFNVKRLRPIELGPFDFERPPHTRSLWISEGVTSYYSGLLMERAGLRTRDQYLASLSSLIAQLQGSPGRLAQSVEQSSLEVWDNSNSGVNPNASTVSYYNKGEVLGLLLDAKVRLATGGHRSLDDVMRRAYERYSGARGFTPNEFRATAEAVAGTSLADWFQRSVSSAGELEYGDLLECFGLRLRSGDPSAAWTLEFSPDPTALQTRNRQAWLGPEQRSHNRSPTPVVKPLVAR